MLIDKISFFTNMFMYQIFLPLLYFVCSRKPVDNNKVVFYASQHKTVHPNMTHIIAKLKETRPQTKCVVLVSDIRKESLIVQYKTFINFIKEMSNAGYVYLIDIALPVSAVRLRKETSVIQLWHACGAFKLWGYSTLKREGWHTSKYRAMLLPYYRNITHVPVSSPDVVPHYAEAFNIDIAKVLPLGVPRTDMFFQKDYLKSSAEKIRSLFPEINGRTIILFCPTFRGLRAKDARYPYIEDVYSTARKLGTRFVIILKMHPWVKEFSIPEDLKNTIFSCGSATDINQILGGCDILVTDYSSVIFEYSLFGKPAVFFSPDHKEYTNGRGFYYDYKTFIPGPLAETSAELVQILEKNQYDAAMMSHFKEKFMKSCDGHSSERIISMIMK